MKVLIIHTTYKIKGGEDSVVFNEMELLKSNGVEVELLQFSNEGKTLLKIVQLPFNISSYKKTKKKLKSFSPDIVHIHNLHFGGSNSVLYAIKAAEIPFVFTLHNYRLLCPSATLFSNGKIFTDSIKKQFPWKAIRKGVYQNSRILTFWLGLSMLIHYRLGSWKMCNGFIVLSNYSKELFLQSKMKFIGDRIFVKPNFCYASSIIPAVRNDYFLYVGRLSEEKGITLLLKTFSKNKLPLKIVGSGPLENEVREYGNRCANIEFLGVLKKEDVVNLLRKCSALIFPSLWYETFGMVVIEAFSTANAVIASDLGPMKDLITNQFNGLHFEAGNESDLQKKIETWQNLPDHEKQTYRNNARLTYEKYYTPATNAKELLSIYNTILKKKEGFFVNKNADYNYQHT